MKTIFFFILFGLIQFTSEFALRPEFEDDGLILNDRFIRDVSIESKESEEQIEGSGEDPKLLVKREDEIEGSGVDSGSHESHEARFKRSNDEVEGSGESSESKEDAGRQRREEPDSSESHEVEGSGEGLNN
ncbi:hypothetical protein FO519_004236 [Halicephalobus sp. NKZ332]|nr:hypothetical protein FO519_004236 [Halicephalobus sp. NKZ332]